MALLVVARARVRRAPTGERFIVCAAVCDARQFEELRKDHDEVQRSSWPPANEVNGIALPVAARARLRRAPTERKLIFGAAYQLFYFVEFFGNCGG